MLGNAVDIGAVGAALVTGGDVSLDATDERGTRVRAHFVPSAMTSIDGPLTRVSGAVRSGPDARLDFTAGRSDVPAILMVGPDPLDKSGLRDQASRSGRVRDLKASQEFIVVGIDLVEMVTALAASESAYAIVHPSGKDDSVLAMEIRPTEICRPPSSDWVALRGTSGLDQKMNMVWSAGVGGWMRVGPT